MADIESCMCDMCGRQQTVTINPDHNPVTLIDGWKWFSFYPSDDEEDPGGMLDVCPKCWQRIRTVLDSAWPSKRPGQL
jgi:hypothetical protein